ncbi:MAG: SpoIIE family protein phosphatase [Evtepia sp.]|nr:SpoIIE family protein phosphatase [Evtepia sp.]
MATKEKSGRKLLRFPRRDTVNLSRRAFLGAAETAVGFLLGAVLAGAELFGRYTPFGVAAVAAAGSGLSGFFTLAGTCLGYLCLSGLTDGMRYAAAAILTYSVAFAFYDARLYQRSWFMPSIACLLTAMTGFVCRAGEGWHGEDLVFFVTEVAFTGVAAYCYRIFFGQWSQVLDDPQGITPRQGAGVLMLASTVLMALGRVEILETFSLGRLLAVVVVLAAARRGVGEGVLTGACAGVALDLSSGKDPYYSMVFTLVGLACGLCHQQRKLVAGAVGAAAGCVAVLWTWEGGLRVGMPLEFLVGAILFLCLPLRVPAREEAVPALPQATGDQDGVRRAVSRRMGEMAAAFHTLYDNLRETLRPEEFNRENPAEIFTRTADKICAKCVLRTNCWQKDYEGTRNVCNDATGPMLERGRALATDFAGQFTGRCVHFPEFLGAVNRELTAFLRRRQELKRTWQTRSALCSQYAKMDQLMSRAAAEISAQITPDLPRQEKLAAFLRSMNLTGGVVYYDKEGRLRVETPDTEELRGRPARRELAQVLGVPLREGEAANGRLTFLQAEPFRATAAVAGAPRRGEEVSGDTGTWFRREDGMLFLLLCDGMGSGPGAKQESAQAAKLIENFLRAGMDPEQALETVSSALSLRGGAGGSTTVDLLSVDLFTGRCRVYKQGAAPTYVRRDRRIKCAVGSSLPAGILPGDQARPDSHSFRGEQGDWILLITDGILCGREDDWLRELLAGYQGTSPGELAEKILRESEERCQGEDDGTVIAVHLEKGREG